MICEGDIPLCKDGGLLFLFGSPIIYEFFENITKKVILQLTEETVKTNVIIKSVKFHCLLTQSDLADFFFFHLR